MGQAKHAPTTRRSLLADCLALSTAAGGSAIVIGSALAAPVETAPHPDALILAMVPELARLHKAQRDAHEVEMDYEGEAHRLARERLGLGAGDHPGFHSDWPDTLHQAMQEVGFYDKESLNEEAVDALRAKLDELVDIRATTLDGLLIKARYGEDWEMVDESIMADLAAINEARQA